MSFNNVLFNNPNKKKLDVFFDDVVCTTLTADNIIGPTSGNNINVLSANSIYTSGGTNSNAVFGFGQNTSVNTSFMQYNDIVAPFSMFIVPAFKKYNNCVLSLSSICNNCTQNFGPFESSVVLCELSGIVANVSQYLGFTTLNPVLGSDVINSNPPLTFDFNKSSSFDIENNTAVPKIYAFIWNLSSGAGSLNAVLNVNCILEAGSITDISP